MSAQQTVMTGGPVARMATGGRGRAGADRGAMPIRLRRLVVGWLDRPLASFHLLMAVFVLMLGFGLVMVLSSSAATAFRDDDSAFSVFTNQAVYAALGLIGFVFVMRMPIGLIRRVSTTALIVSMAMLVAVLVPGIGSRINGARSWITIGSNISFQPSEVAKLALLLWAAHVMASARSPRRSLKSLLVPVVPVFGIIVLLLMLQPDLGTTVTLAVVFMAVLFFAGAPLWIFVTLAGLGVGGVFVLAQQAGYRVARITAWLHPEAADAASTYQSFQGLYAMGSGGVFGVGIGQSKMKWGRLPMADSDFIFAVIGEELGLVGTLTVVGLFALLAFVGLRIARRNTDPFIKIAAGGATIWLTGQAAINIGYVVGLLPVTGLPLPMFSRGGTSLVVTIAVFGLLANFARREPAAQAALSSATPRGLAAFLGLGRSKVSRPVSRGAARRAAKVRAQRQARRARSAAGDRLASVPRVGGTAYDGRAGVGGARPEARARTGRSAAPGRRGRRPAPREASYPPRAGRAASAPRYRLRRALGFPPPARRAARPGRTVRP